MKVLKLKQGSPEWLAVRKTTHNASEAPAMKGVSKYKSYIDLVREKATGITEEVSPEKQRQFDKGHESEEKARPLVEAMIDDSLYPMTATDDEGYLLASSDGATLPPKGGTGFEHKLWNEALAAAVSAGMVPESHTWQLDQQIAVFGFEKIIFVVSNGTPDKFVSCEYRTTPERIAALMAGWKQFDEDVANYTPEVIEQKPILVAKNIDTLPALLIEITGRVTASNLVEFKGHATAVISSINTSLQTDQDFVDATKAAKYLRDVEDNAKRAKANALSQTASIDELFKALDEVIKMAADVRKDLEKKISQEKDNRKQEMVIEAKNELAAFVKKLNTGLGGHMQDVTADFGAVIKGLSSIDSMRSKIAAELNNAKATAAEISARIDGNIKSLEVEGQSWRFLFPDLHSVCAKASDDFAALLAARVAQHKEAEEKRLAADRERIRKEEQERADKEAADRIEKERLAAEAAKPVITNTTPEGQAGTPAGAQPEPAAPALHSVVMPIVQGRIHAATAQPAPSAQDERNAYLAAYEQAVDSLSELTTFELLRSVHYNERQLAERLATA